MTHQELGMALVMKLRDELGDAIVVESMPRLEGRQLVMMIAPGKKKSSSEKSANEKAAPKVAETAAAPAAPARATAETQ